MSETKFTQGDWKALIKPIGAKPLSIFQDITIQAGEHDVASVFLSSDDPEWLKHREQAIRDAHLIAATPEMYEMLERLSDLMPFLDEQTHPQIECDALKYDIDKLLAKARGEL